MGLDYTVCDFGAVAGEPGNYSFIILGFRLIEANISIYEREIQYGNSFGELWP